MALTFKEVATSTATKVTLLGLLGVGIMLAIALSLAYTEGKPLFSSPVLYSSIKSDDVTVKSDGIVPCSTDELGACGTVFEYGTANSSVSITVSISDGDAALADVSYAEVRVCYGKAFTEGRPWRAPSDTIGKDKQCGAVACKNVTFTGGEGTCDYKISDQLGTAVYFFRTLLVKGTGPEPDYVGGAENQEEYFQINAYPGRSTSIIIGVAVMSVVSWVVLIGGFIFEKVKTK